MRRSDIFEMKVEFVWRGVVDEENSHGKRGFILRHLQGVSVQGKTEGFYLWMTARPPPHPVKSSPLYLMYFSIRVDLLLID